jgi:hypothetical protein
MILPAKHIKLSQSLIGLGGFILANLKEPMTIDEIWAKYSRTSKKRFPGYHDFDNIILAVNLLHLMGACDIDNSGRLYNAVS